MSALYYTNMPCYSASSLKQYWTVKGRRFLMVNLDFESFTVATMTWLTILFVVFTIWSFLNSWLITGFVTRLTRQVSLVEQELSALPEHLSSPPGFRFNFNYIITLVQSKCILLLKMSYFWISSTAKYKTCVSKEQTMIRVWRYQKGNQNPYIEEEQTTQWPVWEGDRVYCNPERLLSTGGSKVDNVFQGVTIFPFPSQIYVIYFLAV
jgi:hypothetical protein